MSTVPPNENKDLIKEVEVAPEKAFQKHLNLFQNRSQRYVVIELGLRPTCLRRLFL